jgi:hypothetical protein
MGDRRRISIDSRYSRRDHKILLADEHAQISTNPQLQIMDYY